RELRPDVIVTQSHCEVCAVSLRDVEEAVCSWLDARPRIVSLAPDGLADVWQGIRQVAEALDVPKGGDGLVERLRGRMQRIEEQTVSIAARRTVACVEWIEPLMASGNWMPELVSMAGGVNLFGEAGRHAPWLAWDDLVGKDPDVILVLPCGFDIARTRQELPFLTRRPGWDELRVVRAGQVYLLDGNQFFNRP